MANPDAQLAQRLKRLGIASAAELLLNAPASYDDYSNVLDHIPRDGSDEWRCIRVTVSSPPQSTPEQVKPPRVFFDVIAGADTATVTIFGAVYAWKKVRIGDQMIVRCKVTGKRGLCLDQVEQIAPAQVGRISAVYRAWTGQASAAWLHATIQANLEVEVENAANIIRAAFTGATDDEILRVAHVPYYETLEDLLLELHRPLTAERGKEAIEVARRISAHQMLWQGRQRRSSTINKASALSIDPREVEAAVSALPFRMTDHQFKALNESLRDLAAPAPMGRVISGDVATGKSAVFGVLAAVVQKSGRLVVIIAPNVLLVRQIAAQLKSWYPTMPIKCIEGNGKREIDFTGNPVIVGTTAVLSRVTLAPALLVLDEQHKFGRGQREHLAGPATNILECTATAIPRTAALVSHGGMAVSIMSQSPVRREVKTKVFDAEDRERMFAHIKKVVEAGGQVAIVYPAIESESERRSSIEATKALWDKQFPGRVAYLHGGLTDNEKQQTLDQIMRNERAIIVATVILEVGLTLPSLRALYVVDAHRFGLSQLHQLRGRVARTGGTGYFAALVPSDTDDESRTRLALLEQHADGHSLAEHDLEVRGCGDLSSEASDQSGAGKTLFTGLKVPYRLLKELA